MARLFLHKKSILEIRHCEWCIACGGVNSSGNLQRSSAIFQNDKFEQSGLQKYKQPTKDFCLIENLEEFFSEIKSSSNFIQSYKFPDKSSQIVISVDFGCRNYVKNPHPAVVNSCRR